MINQKNIDRKEVANCEQPVTRWMDSSIPSLKNIALRAALKRFMVIINRVTAIDKCVFLAVCFSLEQLIL